MQRQTTQEYLQTQGAKQRETPPEQQNR